MEQAKSSRHQTILLETSKSLWIPKEPNPYREAVTPGMTVYSIPLFMKVEHNTWKHFGNPHSTKPTVMTHFSKPLSVKIFSISQLTV